MWVSYADLRDAGALILQPGQDERPLVLETIPFGVESGQVCVSLYTNIKSPVFPPQEPRQGQHHVHPPARSQRPYGVSLCRRGGVLATCPPRCRSRLRGALPREIKQIQRLTPAEISVGAAERWFHPANAGPLRPTTRAPINKTTASPAKRLRGLEGGGLSPATRPWPEVGGTCGPDRLGGWSWHTGRLVGWWQGLHLVPLLCPCAGEAEGQRCRNRAVCSRHVPAVSPKCQGPSWPAQPSPSFGAGRALEPRWVPRPPAGI